MSSLSRSRSPKRRGRYGSPRGRSRDPGIPKPRRGRSPGGKRKKPLSIRRVKNGKIKGARGRSWTPEEKRRSVTRKGKRRSPSIKHSPKLKDRSSRRKYKSRSPSRSSSEGEQSKRKNKSRRKREKRSSRRKRKKSKRRRRSVSSSSSSSFSSSSESESQRRRGWQKRRSRRYRSFEDSSSSDTCSSISSNSTNFGRRQRRRGGREYRGRRGKRGRRRRSKYRGRSFDWDPQAGDEGYFCDPHDVAVVFRGKIVKVIDGGRNLIVNHQGKDQSEVVKRENFTMDEKRQYDVPRTHKPDYVVETDCESAAAVVNIRVQRGASKFVEKKYSEMDVIRHGQHDNNCLGRDGTKVLAQMAREHFSQERETEIQMENHRTQQYEAMSVDDESKEADIIDQKKGILSVNELSIMFLPCQQHHPYSYGPRINDRY